MDRITELIEQQHKLQNLIEGEMGPFKKAAYAEVFLTKQLLLNELFLEQLCRKK